MALRDTAVKLFTPKERLTSIYEINFDYLSRKGIKGLIVDVENTLLSPQAITASLMCINWFERLRARGFQACLISSDLNATRVTTLSKTLKLPSVHFALKPFPWAIEHAIYDILGLTPPEVALVGDTLLTDILPGNMLAMHTILVEPVAESDDSIGHWVVRRVGDTVARVITGK